VIGIGIIVKPERKIAFSWSAIVNEAILDDLKSKLLVLYPQYADDEYLEIFLYNGLSKPETIRNDDDLRRLLKVAKMTSKRTITIGLETPTKNFSAWSFKDVCDEYNLSDSSDPDLEVIPPFLGIEAAPLESDLEKEMLTQLLVEVECMVQALNLRGANEATKSMIVGAFLVKATRLFNKDLFLAAQRNLSGRRGHGPVDFSVHSRKGSEYTLGVTEVKKDDFVQGVAQNIVQLESALTAKKRKRGVNDLDGEEQRTSKMRTYGIVTDSKQWMLIECTMNEDDTVSYKMTELERTLNFAGNWQDDARFVFARLVWLWSRMVEEIPARDNYARKASSSPSARRASSPPSVRKTIL
jgi:hypothetical protein